MNTLHHVSLATALLAAVLAGCGQGERSDQPGGGATPAATQPADADLAALYNRSCRSCHRSGAGGAPRTGDADAWTPRLTKGMDTLVDNTVKGFRGMPPYGLCMDCERQQFEALIRFMAGETVAE